MMDRAISLSEGALFLERGLSRAAAPPNAAAGWGSFVNRSLRKWLLRVGTTRAPGSVRPAVPPGGTGHPTEGTASEPSHRNRSADFQIGVFRGFECVTSAGLETGAPFHGAESGLNEYADGMRATFLVWPRLAVAGCSLMLGAGLATQTSASDRGPDQPAGIRRYQCAANFPPEFSRPQSQPCHPFGRDRLVGKCSAGTVRFEG